MENGNSALIASSRCMWVIVLRFTSALFADILSSLALCAKWGATTALDALLVMSTQKRSTSGIINNQF